jgi:putative tricarboxylic transport membrane protein
MPAEAAAYYEDLFARLVKTASWRKYLAENQFEDGFQRGSDLSRFFDEYTSRMRDILKEAGAKVVR